MAKTKQEVQAEQELIRQMLVGRIPKDYLTKLLVDYRIAKKMDKNTQMPRALAQVVLMVVEKMIGAHNWRNYSPSWKNDFRGKAYEHVLRYVHNFDQTKCLKGKGADPYNYIAQVVYRAFVQAWRKCKQHSERVTPINPNVMYMNNQWEEDQMTTPVNEMIKVDVGTMDWVGSTSNGF